MNPEKAKVDLRSNPYLYYEKGVSSIETDQRGIFTPNPLILDPQNVRHSTGLIYQTRTVSPVHSRVWLSSCNEHTYSTLCLSSRYAGEPNNAGGKRRWLLNCFAQKI